MLSSGESSPPQDRIVCGSLDRALTLQGPAPQAAMEKHTKRKRQIASPGFCGAFKLTI